MKDTTKTYILFTGSGAVFAITLSVLSCISHKALNFPLGLSPITLRNLVKVGVLGGLTGAGIITLELNYNILTKIMDKIKQL